MREQYNLRPECINSVTVYTYKLAICGHEHTVIPGVSSAKLSTPFSVALALVKGSAGFLDYSEENVRNQEILALARKVAVLEDTALTSLSPGVRAARVVVTTDDGVWEKQVDYPKGEPENPAGREELLSRMATLA